MAENETPHGVIEGAAPAGETDWKAEARKWEARAKENNATAKANEAAAKRLADLEDEKRSAEERAAARAEAAEKRAEELELRATRAEVAADKGVPASLLTGSTQAELEAAADALIEFRGEPRLAPGSPAIGRTNPLEPSTDDARALHILGF